MRIAAGIVLFNPDIDRLKENIDSIITQVDELIWVDNGSANYQKVADCFSEYKITKIVNQENLGIATALNQIMQYASSNDIDWVYALDQDSVSQPLVIKKYMKYIHLPDAAMLTCDILDRNYQKDDSSSEYAYAEIDKCITSGSFASVEAYNKVGGYDDLMFIDLVDFDYCYTLIENGYKIYKVNFWGLLHELGNAKTVYLGDKKLVVFNHSPFRQYYLARNEIYIAQKHPRFSKRKLFRNEVTDELKIVLYEKQVYKKLIRRWAGILGAFRLIHNYKNKP